MKKLIVFSAMMATVAAFAGSAEPDGTDFVVTAAAGETYTIGTAIGNYARLVKKGDGEVVLTAATTAFAGEVVIETGTLTISNKTAVGSSASVEVKSGATLWLKVPGTGQSSSPAFPHDVTIAGKGVGGNGALRFTNTGSSYGDSLLNKLTLSDDATIDVSSRWGMFGGKVVELNGHTLTRIGKNNWMMFGILQSTGGPGEVNNVYGTLTFQNSPVIEENVTVVVTNLDSSSYIGLWGASMGSSKGTIKVYNGRSIQAQSGAAQTSNHIGPLHLAGNTATVTLTPQYDSKARAMSVDGAVTSDSGVGLTVNGKGSVWFNNDVTVSGKSYITGGGSVWFNKDMTVNDNLYIQGGCNIYFCGANSARNVKLVMQSGSTATQEDGNTYVRMLRIANGGATSGAFRQLGGVFAVTSGDNGRIGEGSGSRGYYTLEGGEFHASNTTFIAEKPGSFGAFRQTGGLFELKNSSYSGSFHMGYGGDAMFVQTGGTNDTLVRATVQDGGFQMGTNGLSVATISGTGTLVRTSLLQMGAARSVCTNILNIKDGAVAKANRFRKHESSAAGTFACVNVDGGTLMPTYAWGWTAAGGDVYARSPDHFVVWKKGLVFDTSENAANSGTGSTDIPFWFESPTGKGVESVALPTDSAFASAKYIGIARVVFEDATGWGASAYAEYDFATKKLSKIVVTSRGCDYSDGTKAYLESPDRTTRYECALTLSSNEGMCGEFVKRGAPTLELHATNTITGGIAVESGALNACTGGVIPSNTPVRVEAGATLNLFEHPVVLSTFTGAGQVINGAVTVTNAVRATCAELFAGKHATFAGNLTFAPGAAFTITDPENLAAYAHSASATAFTAASVNGTPTLAFEGDAPQGVKWSLFKKNATTYNFGPVIGTMLLLK